MIFRGAYASLRGVGFAYGDFFCFQLWNEALETQATSIQLAKAKSMSSNCCQRASTVYTKPTRCRLKQAYADANATYAVCMGAYASGIICLVEFPFIYFSASRKKTLLNWICANFCKLRCLRWTGKALGAPLDHGLPQSSSSAFDGFWCCTGSSHGGVHKKGVPQARWMAYFMDNPSKMDALGILGVPLF